MTDGFLAKVVSYDPTTETAEVLPLIVENDGTKHPGITAKPVAGVLPSTGDVVLVLTLRNNLDDAYISRFFTASESNGRIVHVVTPANGVYTFKGDYKFEGNVTIEGDVAVTGDVSIEGLVTITIDGQDIEIKMNTVNGLPDVIQKSTGRSAFADSFMTAFGPTVSRIPGGGP